MIEKSLGRVARSRAGRDKGRYAIIVSIVDDEYVLVADGDLRKFHSPKKKKLKHLLLRPEKADTIAVQLEAGEPILDADIRKALEALNYDQPRTGQKEG